MDSPPPHLAATVASLHRVAERIVAPARKPDNEIALEVTPGGFGTPEFEFEGAHHQVRVEGAELVHVAGGEERRAPLRTLLDAAAIVADLLPDDLELDSAPLDIDPDGAAALAAWYRLGDEVLRELAASAAPGADPTHPTLWPEHFDVAIEFGDEAAGERATYGFSPGDESHPEPYAYVTPWRQGVSGDLWQATGFSGAELGYAALVEVADPRVTALDFFAQRRQALVRDRH